MYVLGKFNKIMKNKGKLEKLQMENKERRSVKGGDSWSYQYSATYRDTGVYSDSKVIDVCFDLPQM